MSVDFQIEALTTGAWEAECCSQSTDAEIVLTADSYEGIVAEMLAHKIVCEDCNWYGIFSRPVVDVAESINMHNGGAARVLVALGLGAEDTMSQGWSGSAEDLLARVTLAQAALATGAVVEAQPNALVEALGAGGAQVLDCQDLGDLPERLARVEALALEAKRLGRSVSIG